MTTVIASAGSTNETVLARTEVPNSWTPQGEVMLMVIGSQCVVRTILVTRFESRVMNHIVEKEKENWGSGSNTDQYVAVLGEAIVEYKDRKKHQTNDVDIGVMIDFIDAPERPHVDFYFADVSQGKEGWHVGLVELWRSLTMDADYVRKNQEYILADSFKDKSAAVLKLLQEHRNP